MQYRSMRMTIFFALLAYCSLITVTATSLPSPIYVTVVGGSSSTLEVAGKDAARYLRLLRCGHGPASSTCAVLTSSPPPGSPTLLITTVASLTPTQRSLLSQRHPLDSLSGDAHLVAPLNEHTTVCTGESPRAAMYAVYTLLESLGTRFYLTGDVLPLPNASLTLPLTPILSQPVFAERGIQPFHDFPMGPDWWTADFFRHTATQMGKMKMNKWGFHTYPSGAEPLAWVGTESQFDPATGDILPQGGGAYASSWFLTQNFPRGNVPGSVSRATSNYCCGAATAFPRDCYGSPAQATECWPNTSQASASVLNDAAALLQGAFEWGATTGGISSCLGSEMPLAPPPASNANTSELYRGMFAHAAAAIPAADCFWLWTTEAVEDHSNGKGYPQSNPLWAALTLEINTALAARDAVAPHLAVGSNGWCLGPGDNSSFFDAVIPDPRFSLSSIDGSLGWCDVDPGFSAVKHHPATVIAWMEDDLGLAGGELWVARTLAHAADAALYNASGLLGILWRTFETSPQVAALGVAGWSSTSSTPPTPTGVYQDFCVSNFGADTVATCTELFLALDGAEPGAPTFDASRSKLPRGGQLCCGGPVSPQGGEGPVRVLDTSAWEAWGASVAAGGSAAAAARAGRWVGLMLYHAALAEACLAGQALEAAAAKVVDEASAREVGFPALAAMSWAWEAMVTALLAYASTPGELGMVGAHEGGNWPSNFYGAAGTILPYLTGPCAGVGQSPCYWDNYTQPAGRVLPHTVAMNSPHNSREWCGGACTQLGYPWAGVEFGVACFCGSTLPDPSQAVSNATACTAMPCAAAPEEGCGGSDIISVFPSACPPAPGLPPGLLPSKTYLGQPRMWPSAPRTTVGVKEGGVTVEVVVLAAQQPMNVSAVWWLVPSSGGGVGVGGGGNTTTPLLSTAGESRGIWAASLPIPSDTTDVLEYVVVAQWGDGLQIVEPVEGAQSVVFLD